LLLESDVGISMHPEDLWRVLIRHRLDVLNDFIQLLVLRGNCIARLAEEGKGLLVLAADAGSLFGLLDELITDNLVAEALLHDSDKNPAIVVVSDTPSVVNVSGHELNGVPWDVFGFEQEVLEHLDRSFKI